MCVDRHTRYMKFKLEEPALCQHYSEFHNLYNFDIEVPTRIYYYKNFKVFWAKF